MFLWETIFFHQTDTKINSFVSLQQECEQVHRNPLYANSCQSHSSLGFGSSYGGRTTVLCRFIPSSTSMQTYFYKKWANSLEILSNRRYLHDLGLRNQAREKVNKSWIIAWSRPLVSVGLPIEVTSLSYADPSPTVWVHIITFIKMGQSTGDHYLHAVFSWLRHKEYR